MADGSITFEITADDSDFKEKLGNLGSEAEKATERASKGLSGIGTKLGESEGPATSLFSGIAASATGDTTAAVAVAGNALAHLGRFSAAEGSSAVGPDTLRITEARNVVAGDAILR